MEMEYLPSPLNLTQNIMNGIALIQSKTFLLALLQAVIGAAVIFMAAYPAWGWLIIAKSVLDIVLRLYTSAPITGTLSAQ